jgi:hypothetical protein
MKRVKIIRLVIAFAIIIFVVAAGLIWWNTPCTITNISPAEVSKIEIFNGGTGKEYTITDEFDIIHIIQNLNEVSLKREKISLGYMGYSFRTTIYKHNGDVYKKFIINSSNTIRKDPFFYRDSSESIDYDYIQKLINKFDKEN